MNLDFGTATWLILDTPVWFLSSIAAPFQASFLSAIPAAGVVALGTGCFALFFNRSKRLWGFAALFALSVLFVAVAGLFRGDLKESGLLSVLMVFIGAQFALSAVLVFRNHGARMPAVAFATFNVAYAAWTAFVAGMSFSDSWL
ncbi:MAG: hypothetical protein AAGF90_23000 [Pseudomonadota bacterium]